MNIKNFNSIAYSDASNSLRELTQMMAGYCRAPGCYKKPDIGHIHCEECKSRASSAIEKSHIYFIQIDTEDGYIKIGRTDKPASRLSSLQTGCPYQMRFLLCLEGHPAYELRAHEKYKRHRVRGEWFKPDKEILDDIESIRENGDLNILYPS